MLRIVPIIGIATGFWVSEVRAAPPEWRTESTKDGSIMVKSRISAFAGDSSGGRSLVEFIATTTAKVELAGLVEVLKDASRHKVFLDDAESRTVSTLSDSEWVLYYYTDSPWPIPDNDCVARMRFAGGSEPARATFTLSAAHIVPAFKVPEWLIRKNFPEGPAQIPHKLIRLASASPATDRGAEP